MSALGFGQLSRREALAAVAEAVAELNVELHLAEAAVAVSALDWADRLLASMELEVEYCTNCLEAVA